MKKIQTILLSTFTSLTILSVNALAVFADGGDPYVPHKPIDTGFADLETIVLVGIVLYAVGVSFIAFSQLMKKKFVK